MTGSGGSGGSGGNEVVEDLFDTVMAARDEAPADLGQAAAASAAPPAPEATGGGFLSGEDAISDLLMAKIDPPASAAHATATNAAGASVSPRPAPGPQPPTFLDHLAFPNETDEEIAAGRAEDAEVAHAMAPVERLANYAELDKALDLHVLDTPETMIVAGSAVTSFPLPEAARRASARRLARLMTVLLLAVFAMVLLGISALNANPSAQQPAAAAPAAAIASGAPGNAAASVIPSAQSAGATGLQVWPITTTTVIKQGLKSGEVYDSVTLTIPNLDPSKLSFLAVSSRNRFVDATGAGTPAAGQEVIWSPWVDDDVVVTVSKLDAGAAVTATKSVVIDKNDAMTAAEGTGSVIYGSFPRVGVLTGIDRSVQPATDNLATQPERGELTDWFIQQGAGTYTFEFDFVNQYGPDAAHPSEWLLGQMTGP